MYLYAEVHTYSLTFLRAKNYLNRVAWSCKCLNVMAPHHTAHYFGRVASGSHIFPPPRSISHCPISTSFELPIWKFYLLVHHWNDASTLCRKWNRDETGELESNLIRSQASPLVIKSRKRDKSYSNKECLKDISLPVYSLWGVVHIFIPYYTKHLRGFLTRGWGEVSTNCISQLGELKRY